MAVAKKLVRVAKRTGRGNIKVDRQALYKMSKSKIKALTDKIVLSDYIKKNQMDARGVVEFQQGLAVTDGLRCAPFVRRTERISDVLDNPAIPCIVKCGYKVVGDLVPTAPVTSWGGRIKRLGYGTRNSDLLVVTG